MKLSALSALSPLDGRYAAKVAALRPLLSEFGLMHRRVQVEIEWFIALSDAGFTEFKPLSEAARGLLRGLVLRFSEADAQAIKDIERTTNHDVKAVEYWLKSRFDSNPELRAAGEFVHFACTSEDINNTSHALMLQTARQEVLLPALDRLVDTLRSMAHSLADVPMGEQERAGILAGMERYVASERALGVPIDLVVRDSPKVARTIVEVATEIGADVIAMSTEGRSGVRRLLLGSVAEGVLRLADCPVLTVTPRLPQLEGDAPALDRVLCAVESLEHVESALRHAIALAEMSGARLTIAHIVRLPLELVAPDTTLSDQRLVKFREARVRIGREQTPVESATAGTARSH